MVRYEVDAAAVFTGALGFSLALAWNDAAAAAVRDARVPHGELRRALLVTAAVVLVLAFASRVAPAAEPMARAPGAEPSAAPGTAHRYIRALA